KKAGIDVVTLNVFNWALLQRDETTYDFSLLDETVDRVSENGMKICMATSTAALPAWMAKKYPDVLRTDFEGRKRNFGYRHNACPNSPTFRKYSPLLAKKLAERYKDRKNIVAWHISNEYGGFCYCENCLKAFRVWLKNKYKTLDNLNYEWNSAFWSHTFYDWDEIVFPNALSENFENEAQTVFQGAALDYKRFNSDSIMQNYIDEYDAVRSVIPDVPITTNFMPFFNDLDYHKWAKHMDMVSWDNYPERDIEPAKIAYRHDTFRGMKSGKSFMLMEQTPSWVNWMEVNGSKKPGVMRLWSYQAVAHGADTVMFFQLRMSRGSNEKFHGAVIDHSGRDDTRVFKECSELGAELKKLGSATLGGRTPARAALIFDWNTRWALEASAGPSKRLDYVEELYKYYKAFYELDIPLDIIPMDEDLSGYDLVVAPMLYMMKDGIENSLEAFVKRGGKLILTYMSGYTDENDLIIMGGYPGPLKSIAGVWVEEKDILREDEHNSFEYKGVKYTADIVCDIMHPEGAEVISTYDESFYAGTPVITKNKFGEGACYYVGTSGSTEFINELVCDVAREAGIKNCLGEEPDSAKASATLEMTRRNSDEGDFLFVLNHGDETDFEITCDGDDLLSTDSFKKGDRVKMDKVGVRIIKLQK
ncbi:MAG: beta-galactosidase, partial [Lachnospiraceae bacterium]|nr:beta-galactosidase [Lachnospiraceae bacterium]